MTHLDLFSGIGGFALAARWMGWETVGFVEIDKFCQKVLKKNFPNVPIYGDIKQFRGTQWSGKVDILTGGFPCQPFSTAGRRKGKEDDRYLWPEMLRVISRVQPPFIVGENVYGLVNWSGGLVFEEVQTSLENKGYQVTPVILPACGIDAPHRRDRIWFVAYSQNCYDRRAERKLCSENGRQDGELLSSLSGTGNGLCEQGTITNNNNKRLQRGAIDGSSGAIWQESGEFTTGLFQSAWQKFPTQSPLCGGDDVISNRVDSIKSLGNAVVPKLVYQIFKAISSTMK